MPEDDIDHTTTTTGPAFEDAFAVLGNDIRAEIFQLFVEEATMEMPFSEVRSRMGGDIDPSQLHYHLQQLVGHFIEKTDDTYRVSQEGAILGAALRAGFFGFNEKYTLVDIRQQDTTVDAGFDCHYCGTAVAARYITGTVIVQCPGCEYLYKTIAPPSGVFGDEGDELFAHFSRWMQYWQLGWARRICPICGGPLTVELLTPAELPDDVPISSQDGRDAVFVVRPCTHCGLRYYQSVGEALIADPGLRSFCYERGVDVVTTPVWELEFAGTDKHVTVRSTDPWEVALQVSYGGDTLELVVDGDLTVIERDRHNSRDDGRPSLVHSIRCGVRLVPSSMHEDEVTLSDNEACMAYLRQHRWPNEVTCPHCDSMATIKKGTTSKGAQRYRCQTCDRSFNDLTDTIFAQRGFTLPEMFHIVRAMDDATTATIARQLERSYKSVLDFVHEVQDAHAGKSMSPS